MGKYCCLSWKSKRGLHFTLKGLQKKTSRHENHVLRPRFSFAEYQERGKKGLFPISVHARCEIEGMKKIEEFSENHEITHQFKRIIVRETKRKEEILLIKSNKALNPSLRLTLAVLQVKCVNELRLQKLFFLAIQFRLSNRDFNRHTSREKVTGLHSVAISNRRESLSVVVVHVRWTKCPRVPSKM